MKKIVAAIRNHVLILGLHDCFYITILILNYTWQQFGYMCKSREIQRIKPSSPFKLYQGLLYLTWQTNTGESDNEKEPKTLIGLAKLHVGGQVASKSPHTRLCWLCIFLQPTLYHLMADWSALQRWESRMIVQISSKHGFHTNANRKNAICVSNHC